MPQTQSSREKQRGGQEYGGDDEPDSSRRDRKSSNSVESEDPATPSRSKSKRQSDATGPTRSKDRRSNEDSEASRKKERRKTSDDLDEKSSKSRKESRRTTESTRGITSSMDGPATSSDAYTPASEQRRRTRGVSEDDLAGHDKSPMSSHVQDQFPGQFPDSSTDPYRPPLAATEGGPGLAAEYYGDAGESVADQPGYRLHSPTLIVGAEPHLQPASAVHAPPPEPSEMGGVGAAASFFSGDSMDQNTSYVPSSNRPNLPHNSASAPLMGAMAGVAVGMAASQVTGGSTNTSSHQSNTLPAHIPYDSGAQMNHTGTESTQGTFQGSSYSNMAMQSRPRNRGPLESLVEFFRDPEGVAQYEEYSEIIGVCRNCFEPGSSSRNAPRKHRFGKRRSYDRLRVDKQRRYSSSSDDERHKNEPNRLGAAVSGGIAAYGLGKVGETLFKKRHDFGGNDDLRSGRPISDLANQNLHRESGTGDRRYDASGASYHAKSNSSTLPADKSGRRSKSRRSNENLQQSTGMISTHGKDEAKATRSTKEQNDVNVKSEDRSGKKHRKSPSPSREDYQDLRRRKSKKKQKGFFSSLLSPSSSSSSLDKLSSTSKGTRRKRRGSDDKIRNDREAKAALAGLGAATAALALNHQGKSDKIKRTYAKSEEPSMQERQHRYGRGDSDAEWMSETDDSLHGPNSGLAFGSLSDDSDQKPRRENRKATNDPPRQSRIGIAETEEPVQVKSNPYDDDRRSNERISSQVERDALPGRSLRYVDPMPYDDIQPQTRPFNQRDPAQPSSFSHREDREIQQPQPVAPVSSRFYASDQSTIDSLADTGRREESNSRSRKKDQSINHESQEQFVLRRSDTSPARLVHEIPKKSASRVEPIKDDATAVRFALSEEQEERARKDRRRQRREAEANKPEGPPNTGEDENRRSSKDWVAPAAIVAGAAVAAGAAVSETREERRERRRREREREDEEDAQRTVERRRKKELARESQAVEGQSDAADVTSPTKQKSMQEEAASNTAFKHDDYKNFFSPVEVLNSRSADQANVASTDPDADVGITVIDIKPKARDRQPDEPEWSIADTNEPIDLTKLSLPWRVPNLKLVHPTPPASRSPTPFQDAQQEQPVEAVEEQSRESVRDIKEPEASKTKDIVRSDTASAVEPISESKNDKKTSGKESRRPRDYSDSESEEKRNSSPSKETAEESHRPVNVKQVADNSDDSEFAATLAAGAQAAGFDPTMIIEDPTYRRRESPPVADQSRAHVIDEEEFDDSPSRRGKKKRGTKARADDGTEMSSRSEPAESTTTAKDGIYSKDDGKIAFIHDPADTTDLKSLPEETTEESYQTKRSKKDKRKGRKSSEFGVVEADLPASAIPKDTDEWKREPSYSERRSEDSIVAGLEEAEVPMQSTKSAHAQERVLHQQVDDVDQTSKDHDEELFTVKSAKEKKASKKAAKKSRKKNGMPVEDVPDEILEPNARDGIPSNSKNEDRLHTGKAVSIPEDDHTQTTMQHSQSADESSFLETRPVPPPPPDVPPQHFNSTEFDRRHSYTDSEPQSPLSHGRSFSDMHQTNRDVSSPTAIPVNFRRLGQTSGSPKPASQILSSINQPRAKPRPRSTEFRNSTEFRPLWLVERHQSHSELDLHETYPPLPDSHSTSAASSVNDPEEVPSEEIGDHVLEQEAPLKREALDDPDATPTLASFATKSHWQDHSVADEVNNSKDQHAQSEVLLRNTDIEEPKHSTGSPRIAFTSTGSAKPDHADEILPKRLTRDMSHKDVVNMMAAVAQDESRGYTGQGEQVLSQRADTSVHDEKSTDDGMNALDLTRGADVAEMSKFDAATGPVKVSGDANDSELRPLTKHIPNEPLVPSKEITAQKVTTIGNDAMNAEDEWAMPISKKKSKKAKKGMAKALLDQAVGSKTMATQASDTSSAEQPRTLDKEPHTTSQPEMIGTVIGNEPFAENEDVVAVSPSSTKDLQDGDHQSAPVETSGFVIKSSKKQKGKKGAKDAPAIASQASVLENTPDKKDDMYQDVNKRESPMTENFHKHPSSYIAELDKDPRTDAKDQFVDADPTLEWSTPSKSKKSKKKNKNSEVLEMPLSTNTLEGDTQSKPETTETGDISPSAPKTEELSKAAHSDEDWLVPARSKKSKKKAKAAGKIKEVLVYARDSLDKPKSEAVSEDESSASVRQNNQQAEPAEDVVSMPSQTKNPKKKSEMSESVVNVSPTRSLQEESSSFVRSEDPEHSGAVLATQVPQEEVEVADEEWSMPAKSKKGKKKDKTVKAAEKAAGLAALVAASGAALFEAARSKQHDTRSRDLSLNDEEEAKPVSFQSSVFNENTSSSTPADHRSSKEEKEGAKSVPETISVLPDPPMSEDTAGRDRLGSNIEQESSSDRVDHGMPGAFTPPDEKILQEGHNAQISGESATKSKTPADFLDLRNVGVAGKDKPNTMETPQVFIVQNMQKSSNAALDADLVAINATVPTETPAHAPIPISAIIAMDDVLDAEEERRYKEAYSRELAKQLGQDEEQSRTDQQPENEAETERSESVEKRTPLARAPSLDDIAEVTPLASPAKVVKKPSADLTSVKTKSGKKEKKSKKGKKGTPFIWEDDTATRARSPEQESSHAGGHSSEVVAGMAEEPARMQTPEPIEPTEEKTPLDYFNLEVAKPASATPTSDTEEHIHDFRNEVTKNAMQVVSPRSEDVKGAHEEDTEVPMDPSRSDSKHAAQDVDEGRSRDNDHAEAHQRDYPSRSGDIALGLAGAAGGAALVHQSAQKHADIRDSSPKESAFNLHGADQLSGSDDGSNKAETVKPTHHGTNETEQLGDDFVTPDKTSKGNRNRRAGKDKYDSDDSADSGYDIQKRRRQLEAHLDEEHHPTPVASTTKNRSSELFDSSPSYRGMQSTQSQDEHDHQDPAQSRPEKERGIGPRSTPAEPEWSFASIDDPISTERPSIFGPHGTRDSMEKASEPAREGNNDNDQPRDVAEPNEPSTRPVDFSDQQDLSNTTAKLGKSRKSRSKAGSKPADLTTKNASPIDGRRSISGNSNGHSRQINDSTFNHEMFPSIAGSPDSIHAIIRTPDQFRTTSGQSTRSSGTPPLRRTERSTSADLRGANKKVGRARISARELVDQNIASSSSYDPVVEEGKGKGRADMADFEGWGDVRGESPMSPSRPPSMRKRQSMHFAEMEQRLAMLASENGLLQTAKSKADQRLEEQAQDHRQQRKEYESAIQDHKAYMSERDATLAELNRNLKELRQQVADLKQVNEELEQSGHARGLDNDQSDPHRELEDLRVQHATLVDNHEDILSREVDAIRDEKDEELRAIRSELEDAQEEVRRLKQEILDSQQMDDIKEYDEDYFDSKCQYLFKHLTSWVTRYSKLSDNKRCFLAGEIRNETQRELFEDSMLDGSEVDDYLQDRHKRRDVFMSVTMSLIFKHIFARYLFGMDREHRQKLKALDKTLQEVGPISAVHKWRATTLMLLSKRPAFKSQRDSDSAAVVDDVWATLASVLPPPATTQASQCHESLRRIVDVAVDLSIDMRLQRAEYSMLPPPEPDFDTNGDINNKIYFTAVSMNERSDTGESNEDIEEQGAYLRIVLFPLVVKSFDDEEQVVVCPAQVHVAQPIPKSKKTVRVMSAQGGRSEVSYAESQDTQMEGGMF